MTQRATDVSEFIADLNAGVFEKQLAAVLNDVALGTAVNGKQGEVTVKFKFKRISETSQVNISHSIEHKAPTSNGHKAALVEGGTPMHVLPGGRLSLMPEQIKAADYID